MWYWDGNGRDVVRALFLLTFALLNVALPAKAAELLIFAASSTANLINDAAQIYERETGIRVKASFAGSSKLAKQIYAGAPADLFLSANIHWMDYLEENDAIEVETRTPLLSNSLVLVQPHDATPLLTLETVATGLRDSRLAMGDPDHVPAGIYAKQALIKLNLWPQVKDRIAAMPSVRTALALVSRGEVAAGIVYASDATASDKIRVSAHFSSDNHQKIHYPIAIVKGRKTEAALNFLEFLKSDQSVKLFTNHGFSVSN